MAGITDYEKLIEDLGKKVELIKKQISGLSEQRNGLIEVINKETYKAKAEAEKIVADAKAEAEKIISAANEQKGHNDAESARLATEWTNLGEKGKQVTTDEKVVSDIRAKLTRDQANLADQVKDKLSKINLALTKTSELQRLLIGYVQEISKKIKEIEVLVVE